MKVDQVKRLNALETENARLKRAAVAHYGRYGYRRVHALLQVRGAVRARQRSVYTDMESIRATT